MNNATARFALDLDRQDPQVYVTVRKTDTAKALSVMLRESGTPYSIAEGTEAVLAATKPDGSYISAACTITDNRITVVLPATFTADAGKLEACFKLTGSGAALTSPAFTIFVEEPAAEET